MFLLYQVTLFARQQLVSFAVLMFVERGADVRVEKYQERVGRDIHT